MLGELFQYFELRRRRLWSVERIRERQERLLGDLVGHAYRYVPFYRDWFDRAGIHPDRIRTIEDLGRVPVVRKPDVRASELADRVAIKNGLNRCERVQTSGSTGIPAIIYYSKAEKRRRSAVFQCAFSDLGSGFFDRRLYVGLVRPDKTDWATRLLYLPYWLNKRCKIEDSIAVARKFKPDVIYGLVSQLHIFALQIRKEEADDIRPSLVVTGGEMLSPQTRALLENTFGAPVRSRYAAWEFGVMATDCPDGNGYHLTTDDLLVECIKNGQPASPGEAGEIVITSLTSRVMPFIRFSLGDLATLRSDRCTCGHPHPRLEDLQGRCDDLIVRKDGVLLAPFRAIHPFYKRPDILQYRVTQEAIDTFSIEYVARAKLKAQVEEDIRAYFKKEFFAREVNIQCVSRIPLDPSGKIRKIISRVERTKGDHSTSTSEK